MRRKKIFPLTDDELEALPTKRLLARLRHLHQCEESLALSDRETHDYVASNSIEFKDSPEWIAEYNRLKKVLALREHIPKGAALVQKRRKRAQQGKSVERKYGKRKQR